MSTEIKIDKSTLPKNGEWVKFTSAKGQEFEGEYQDSEEIFHVRDDVWFFAWEVSHWESIERGY